MEIERSYFEKYQHKGTVLQDPQDREFIFTNSNITDSMETLVQDKPIAEKVQDLLRSNQGFTLEYLESQLNQKLAGILQELQADFIIYETDGKYYTL
ncbi:hypothetical protein HDV04_004319 [Boothiomyces sp. JEL0838]|nr:hypothetical protein HDV04_004319 [Boothiomyces sp. JEL0838]